MSGSGSGAAPAAPAAGGAAAASSEPVGRIITLEELATHKTLKSAWIAVNGGVFDATSYMDEHPGGSEQIMNFAGRDATKDWEMIHSNSARTILKGLRVGSLPEGVGVRIAAGAAGSGGDGGSMLPYLVPVLVLAFAVWYQMFGGAEVLGMGGSASSVAAPGGA